MIIHTLLLTAFMQKNCHFGVKSLIDLNCASNNVHQMKTQTLSSLLKDISTIKLHNNFDEVVRLTDSFLISSPKQLLSPRILTIIIKAYSNAGYLPIFLLKTMRELNIQPNEYHYGAIIHSCRVVGQWEMALELFNKIDDESTGVKNNVIYNSMLSTLGDAKQYQYALNIFLDMQKKGIPRDSFTYTAMISVCEKCGKWQEAVSLYEDVIAMNMTLSAMTLNAVLSACASGRLWEQCIRLFSDAKSRGVPLDNVSYSILISVYGDMGQVAAAEKLFHDMSSSSYTLIPIRRDTGTYNALITVFERNKQWQKALHFLKVNMTADRILPDKQTYTTAMAACSQAGYWRLVLKLFAEMESQDIDIPRDKVVYNTAIQAIHIAAKRLLILEFQHESESGHFPSTTTNSSVDVTLEELSFAPPSKDLIWFQYACAISPTAEKLFDIARQLYNDGVDKGLLAAPATASPTQARSLTSNSSPLKPTVRSWSPSNTSKPRNALSRGNGRTAGSAEDIDLHGMSRAMAQTVVSQFLLDITEKRRNVTDIRIITGRGRHVNSNGKSGVLKLDIVSYLASLTPCNHLIPDDVEGNDGCVVLRKSVIDSWLLANTGREEG